MRKTTIAGMVAAAAIAAACSGGNSVENTTGDAPVNARGTAAAKSSTPTTAKVGGSLTVNTSGITATWTLDEVETRKADQFGMEPDNGGKWVLAKVTVKVSGDRETPVCSCDLSIISKSGKVYESGYASFKNRPDLTVTTVAPGQNTDGWVTFPVTTADLPGARLQLKQQSLLADTAFGYWTLGLK